eukprot:gene1560-45507_t
MADLEAEGEEDGPTPQQVSDALEQVAAGFDVRVYKELVSAAGAGFQFQATAAAAVQLWSSAGSGDRKRAGERIPPNACPISHLARIEDEKEVLVPPYSPLLVRGSRVKRCGVRDITIISAEILDGRVVAEVEKGGCDVVALGMPQLAVARGSHAPACII